MSSNPFGIMARVCMLNIFRLYSIQLLAKINNLVHESHIRKLITNAQIMKDL